MMQRTVDVDTFINNTPDAVLAFIADCNNRTKYIPALKSLTNVQGEPGGQSWDWQFEVLGMSFSGTARSTNYQPGRAYAFETQGDLGSQWQYTATAEGDGARLAIHVSYSVPDDVVAKAPPGIDLGAMEQAEAARVFSSLQTILSR